jgi:hypothetical protein
MITVGQCLSEESSIRDIILYQDVLFEISETGEVILDEFISAAFDEIMPDVYKNFKEEYPNIKVLFNKFKSVSETVQLKHITEAYKDIRDAIKKYGVEKGLTNGYLVYVETVLVPGLLIYFGISKETAQGLAIGLIVALIPMFIRKLAQLAKKTAKSIKSAAIEVKKKYKERKTKKFSKKSKEDEE